MKVINLDGLTLVGQGSEWFWAMLQVVLLAATILVIARQLRAQASANAQARIESLYAEWSSYEMQYRRLVLALHLKYEGLQGTQWPGSLTWEKAQPIAVYMANVAYLLKKGHVTIDEVSPFSFPFRHWIVALKPFFDAAGPHAIYPYGLFERLASDLATEDRRQGRDRPLLSTPLWLDDIIERTTSNLRLEEERKAGLIPGPPTVTAA
jgi:hypothetical protein